MYQLGAEWQVTIQAVDPGDRGGTTCWMGQSYGNMPWLHDSDRSYTNEAWVAEILRLNFDPANLHEFRAGDLVEITVRQAEFYGGKRNINEAHDIDPASNFDIRLVTANYGLPAPEVITLADVMQPGRRPANWTTWPAIFDQTRATGGEHWQGMRVRLNNLSARDHQRLESHEHLGFTALHRDRRRGPVLLVAPPPLQPWRRAEQASSTPSASSIRNPAPAARAPMATNCLCSR